MYPLNFDITLSFGIYIAENSEYSVRHMLDRAAVAQKATKNNYKSHVSYFDEALKEQEEIEITIVSEMKRALENGEFKIYLQPKVDMRTGKIIGSEALVRWVHPEKGLISPRNFIPIFENNGFITELDYYIFETVSKQLDKWRSEGIPVLPVSVNVSRADLYDPNLFTNILKIVENHGIPHEYIEFELTEISFISDNHKLDGSYEESVMDWAEDGYIDVIDCFYCALCINGNELYSASLENDHYYTIEGATLSIPVIADGFGIKYEWTGPENGPKIVEGTENASTVQIHIEDQKGYLGNTYTYICKVNDMFFNESIFTVEVSVEELGNLYAVSYSSQYAELADQLPGRQYVMAGESITIPNVIPEMPGYQFLYWYAGSDRLNPGDTYTPYQNTIIMPYMAEEYDITLYSGYEGELFGTHLGCYGQTYVLPELDYMPEGYIFFGWTDVEGSTEVKYKVGDRYTIKGDATLYPVIVNPEEVAFTVYANDGTDRVIYSTTLAELNGAKYYTIPEDLELPTKDGYVCTGFVDNPDSSYYGIKYGPGSTLDIKPYSIELYAYWELPNYLHFEAGMDGVSGLPSDMSFESAQSYQIPQYFTPYCEGYEFLYWEDQNGNTYNPDDYVVVNGPTILTAVWEKLDTDNYEIWIAGQKVSKANPVVQCGDGTATVVDDGWGNASALVLDNATITGTEGIRTEYNSLTIEVYGESTINVTAVEARGITGPNGNIRITGPGVLNVEVRGDDAIGIEGLYSVDYATVNVVAKINTSGSNAYGVSCLSGGQYRKYS